ncbi:hypothetical protein [Cardinium endosymbiont of Bemisia tabaci]|nr:hypothetical protein [Cardinium endosymbiont of Bemisia tabaci]
MKYKSIKKGLISPNILFPAAYLLFSAEICSSSPKDKPRNGIGNGYVSTPQVKQTNKIEEISDPTGEALCDDLNQLDPVLAIDSAEDDTLLDTDPTDTDIPTISPVEPSKDSVAEDASKASVVDTTSKQEQKKKKEGSTRAADCAQPLSGPVVQEQLSEKKDENLIDLNGPSDGNTDGTGASLCTFSQDSTWPRFAIKTSLVPVRVNNDNPNGMLDSNRTNDGNKDDVSPPSSPNKPGGNPRQNPPQDDRKALLSQIQGSNFNQLKKKLSNEEVLGILNDRDQGIHKKTMSDILKFLCNSSQYSPEVRSVALEKFLAAPAGTYSDDKVILLEKFFDQKFDDLRSEYNDSILQIAIKQVRGADEGIYSLKTVHKAELLSRNISMREDPQENSDNLDSEVKASPDEWED